MNKKNKSCMNCRYGQYSVEHILGECVCCERINNHGEREYSNWKPINEEEFSKKIKELNNINNKVLIGNPDVGYKYVDISLNVCESHELNKKEMNKNMMKHNNFYNSAKHGIRNVIFNDPATIVYWVDGTKTTVKADGEAFDPEKGLAMAIAKKFLGNQGNYYEVFKEWLPNENGVVKKVNKPKMLVVHKTGLEAVLLTPAQIAEKLGCSEKIIQKKCREGVYPGAKKVGGKWKIPYPLKLN